MVRIGVVGAGHLGRIHARLLAQVEGAQLVGIADPLAEARLPVADECRVPAFADYRELIGRIDAAVVATPTQLHFRVASDLLAHGIHLLVEKPLAASVEEADALVDAAAQAGVVLQVGHIERFNPALAEAAPFLTEPRYIDTQRYSGYTFRSTDIGVVHDLMIHDLDVVLSLVRAPLRHVAAVGVTVIGEHEDAAQARLEFADGCVANLSASRVSYHAARQMQVWSEHGQVSIDFATRCAAVVEPSALVRQRRFDADALTAAEKAHYRDHLFDELLPLRRLEAPPRNAILDEQRDFVDAIRTGRAPRVTGAQAREVLIVAETILHEIRTHRWQTRDGARIGPEARPEPSILRGPHLGHAPTPRKEAG